MIDCLYLMHECHFDLVSNALIMFCHGSSGFATGVSFDQDFEPTMYSPFVIN